MNKDQILALIRQEIQADKNDARFSPSLVPYHIHNNLDAPKLPFVGLSDVPSSYTGHIGDLVMVNSFGTGLVFNTGYLTVATNTNGTTPVNVFGSSGAPFALTVTAVYLISLDTTAGNITLKQASNTVATIAKGTVTAAMTGASSLTNTAYAKGDACTVVSDSAGNATVIITFTT